jgi:SagB-type dehydrogenase family enzyme
MVDAREYHERSSHSPESVRRNDFSLDFDNKPRPYKVYEDRGYVEPPDGPDTSKSPDTTASPASPETPALDAIATTSAEPEFDADSDLDFATLHALCHYAAGVTKTLEKRGRRMRFRAASCTGKLYHVDLYVVTGDLDGLDAGVYHFDPDSGGFDVLREGDFRGVLAAASGGHDGVADAPVTVVATSEWWRNAWKYRERTYRHAFWDSGTMLANLLAVAHGDGYRASVVTGFDDDRVAALLGVDPSEEAPVELVPLGSGQPTPDPRHVPAIDPEEAPLSENPIDNPLNADAWRQSALRDADAVRDWRATVEDANDLGTHGVGDGELVELDPVDRETASSRPLGTTIRRRGSLREYGHDAISDRLFATVLDRALRGAPLDCLGASGTQRVLDCYCLVHAVDGVPGGAYQYHPDERVLERVGDTDRRTAGHLALDQGVVGDAAANVYLLADVDRLHDVAGNRGYRVAQLAGGIALGRLYLATYAHRALGGRGFTFYDDRVTAHLSPRAAGQAPMTLFAFGKPEK